MAETETTTADLLIGYRNELRLGGFEPHEISTLVSQAAYVLLEDDGLKVRREAVDA